MNKLFVAGCALCVMSVAWATPTATVRSVTQDASTGVVKVVYDLSEAGIVTLSAETNAAGAWIRMDDAVVRATSGDVGHQLVANTGYTALWKPDPAVGRCVAANDIRVILTVWSLDNPPDWLVVDLIAANSATFYASTNAMPNCDFADKNYWWSRMAMRKIPAKNVTWRMGEKTSTRRVMLTDDYYMGVVPMTMGQYTCFSNGNGAQRYSPDIKPLNANTVGATARYNTWRGKVGTGANIVWPESKHAVSETSTLGKLRTLTGVDFDLPTVAQWEYACRAGCGNDYNMGTDSTTEASKQVKCNGTASSNPDLSAQFPPNRWGLYDMHGNIEEQCLDWSWPESYVETENPKGPSTADQTANTRVLRGGSSGHTIQNCAAHSSVTCAPDTVSWWCGARLICPATLTYTAAEKTPEQ